ncbi:hypothetical protein Moror_14167 [Moniliophthora roreri MCA 2997]|uniref:Uncharacterized protein n=1 Tax=Moniliophthora roreri (strain MCA 2997) TaxID=1381753 RepID=V2YSZ4_MONRO|nr:hypothetical protein Moror_14167 [Moniliophthora roreri MCA 2997]
MCLPCYVPAYFKTIVAPNHSLSFIPLLSCRPFSFIRLNCTFPFTHTLEYRYLIYSYDVHLDLYLRRVKGYSTPSRVPWKGKPQAGLITGFSWASPADLSNMGEPGRQELQRNDPETHHQPVPGLIKAAHTLEHPHPATQALILTGQKSQLVHWVHWFPDSNG